MSKTKEEATVASVDGEPATLMILERGGGRPLSTEMMRDYFAAVTARR